MVGLWNDDAEDERLREHRRAVNDASRCPACGSAKWEVRTNPPVTTGGETARFNHCRDCDYSQSPA